MAQWRAGVQVDVVEFNFAMGVHVSHSLNDDGTNPQVGQTFFIRVIISVIGGGFDADVQFDVPPHLQMPDNRAGSVKVFPRPPSTSTVTFPGTTVYTFPASSACTLLDEPIKVQFSVFRSKHVAAVNLAVEDPPFPDPIPVPELGKLVFSKIDPSYVSQSWYTVRSDGKNPQRLRRKYYGEQAVWSPNGQQIAFSIYTDQVENIFIMNADGSGLRQLTTRSSGYCNRPRWSFDGTRILYSFQTIAPFTQVLRVINANGSSDILAVNGDADTGVSAGTWMRDGRWAGLAYTLSTKVTQLLVGRDDFNSLEYIDVLPSSHRYVTIASSLKHDYLVLQATPIQGDGVQSEIHRWSIIHSIQPLFGVIGDSPSFSPDGNWIVYSNHELRDKTYLSRVDIEGKSDFQITLLPTDPDELFSDSVPEWTSLP